MCCLRIFSKVPHISGQVSSMCIRQTGSHMLSTFRSRSYLTYSQSSRILLLSAEPVLSNYCSFKENTKTPCICQRNAYSTTMERANRPIVGVKRSTSKMSWEVKDNGKMLLLHHHHTGKTQRFHSSWLRHNCRCNQCVESDSGQRMIEPSELEPQYTIKHVQVSDDEANDVILSWHEEDHISKIPHSYLEKHGYSEEERTQMYANRLPSVSKGTIATFHHQDIIESERGLWNWLSSLNQFGVTLIKDVPAEDGMVGKVAEKISNIVPTIYEKIFDVVSKEHPINIAYSSVKLGFHMDLVYYESPPGIQLLHCLKFDDCVQGGESVTVDAWHVAERMRREHDDDFAVLTRVPATFQKHHFNRKNPVYMTYQRPHIVLGHTGQITNINWAPPFEGPLCVSEEDVEAYYRAYHRFATMLEHSETKIKFRMQVGEVLAFNNRRILHSRNGFNLNGGQRHLQGCYINIDEFKSKVQVLSMKYDENRPARDVFNQSVL